MRGVHGILTPAGVMGKIKIYRRNRGDQKTFAGKMGITHEEYRKIEKLERPLSEEELRCLIALTKAPIEDTHVAVLLEYYAEKFPERPAVSKPKDSPGNYTSKQAYIEQCQESIRMLSVVQGAHFTEFLSELVTDLIPHLNRSGLALLEHEVQEYIESNTTE